jgi:hypothetical protein
MRSLTISSNGMIAAQLNDTSGSLTEIKVAGAAADLHPAHS